MFDSTAHGDRLFTTLFVHRPTAATGLRHRWLEQQLGPEEMPDGAPIRRASLSHHSLRTGAFSNYLAMKKLKKAALGYIATNLTQADVSSLEDIFNSMDINHNGYISLKELDEAIAKGNFDDSILHDLRELRTDLAITGDQKLNWKDFVASTMDRSVALREDNMKMAFDHFSQSSAEYLTIDDLADIFGGKAQASEVMAVLDTDRDGKVSFEDFRHALVESMDEEETDGDDSNHGGII